MHLLKTFCFDVNLYRIITNDEIVPWRTFTLLLTYVQLHKCYVVNAMYYLLYGLKFIH